MPPALVSLAFPRDNWRMQDFERFREMVFEDDALRDRLMAQTNFELFLTLVSAAAGERGLYVTVDEARSRYQESYRAWLERRIR